MRHIKIIIKTLLTSIIVTFAMFVFFFLYLQLNVDSQGLYTIVTYLLASVALEHFYRKMALSISNENTPLLSGFIPKRSNLLKTFGMFVFIYAFFNTTMAFIAMFSTLMGVIQRALPYLMMFIIYIFFTIQVIIANTEIGFIPSLLEAMKLIVKYPLFYLISGAIIVALGINASLYIFAGVLLVASTYTQMYFYRSIIGKNTSDKEDQCEQYYGGSQNYNNYYDYNYNYNYNYQNNQYDYQNNQYYR